MVQSGRIILVSLNIVLSLFVFQNGFLLKRQEIQSKSSCIDAKSGDGKSCWMTPQYKRIILILVDALRYDFLLPPPSGSFSPEESYYRGQMKQVAELVSSNKASIGTLLADPPTTTLQRLKALTTGTLPTFIDAGENFSPEATVNEDSFLYQANTQNRSLTLLGDDTWLSLYPNIFTKTAAYDSFDIFDLNSVDDKIAPKLQEEVEASNSSIIIAHFLGVDHCGHRYGPKHPVMGDTLRKMDSIIGKTAKNMKNDDLLMVIGDHGMTSTGDHGGESENEIKAGIMVYTKSRNIRLPTQPIHQVDVVPTISLLLGLPIPFSSLGTVIVELFPQHLRESAIGMNYEQVKRFAETYSRLKGFSELHSHTAREANTMAEQLSTMSRIQTALRIAWTQFDDSYITIGILGLIETTLYMITNPMMSLEMATFRSGCVLLQFALLYDQTEANATSRTLLTMALSVSCLSSLFTAIVKCIRSSWSRSKISSRHLGYASIIAHSISLFSNSFVVYEAQVTRFLLQSIIILVFLERIGSWPKTRSPYKLSNLLGNVFQSRDFALFMISIVCLRSESYFHKCREEEVGCVDSYASVPGTSLSKDAQIYRMIMAQIVVFALNYYVFHVERRKLESSTSLRILRSVSWPLLGFLFFHSIFQSTDIGKANLIAQFGFLSSLICAAVSFLNGSDGRLIGFSFLLIPLYLLLGDGLQPAIVVFIVLIYTVLELVPKETLPSVIALLISYGFYLTGHTPVISSIPWTAAFVGIPSGLALRIIPAFLVLLHLNISAVFAFFMVTRNDDTGGRTLSLLTIKGVFVCIAASTHRRHLMVWKIFAPKFIFDSFLLISFIIALNLLIIGRMVFRVERN